MKAPLSARVLMLLVFSLAVAGCGASQPESEVAGCVIYRGSPVPSGLVNLIDSRTGQAAIAKLDDSGSFAISGKLLPGKYAVFITPAPPQPLPPGQKQKKQTAPSLPAKVNSPSTSGIELTLAAGKNDVTIEVPQ